VSQGVPGGGELVELGGCDGCVRGCALGCAEAWARGADDRALGSRQVLIGSGVAVVLLSVGPGLVARQPVVVGIGLLTALVGAGVAVLAALAVRAGRPGGDRRARQAFRLLPVGVVGMVLTWVGAVLARVL
jgi:hypothetical protein